MQMSLECQSSFSFSFWDGVERFSRLNLDGEGVQTMYMYMGKGRERMDGWCVCVLEV